MINSKRFARFESLFENRLARNCFTAAGLDFGQHFTTLVNVVDDESLNTEDNHEQLEMDRAASVRICFRASL